MQCQLGAQHSSLPTQPCVQAVLAKAHASPAPLALWHRSNHHIIIQSVMQNPQKALTQVPPTRLANPQHTAADFRHRGRLLQCCLGPTNTPRTLPTAAFSPHMTPLFISSLLAGLQVKCTCQSHKPSCTRQHLLPCQHTISCCRTAHGCSAAHCHVVLMLSLSRSCSLMRRRCSQ